MYYSISISVLLDGLGFLFYIAESDMYKSRGFPPLSFPNMGVVPKGGELLDIQVESPPTQVLFFTDGSFLINCVTSILVTESMPRLL